MTDYLFQKYIFISSMVWPFIYWHSLEEGGGRRTDFGDHLWKGIQWPAIIIPKKDDTGGAKNPCSNRDSNTGPTVGESGTLATRADGRQRQYSSRYENPREELHNYYWNNHGVIQGKYQKWTFQNYYVKIHSIIT